MRTKDPATQKTSYVNVRITPELSEQLERIRNPAGAIAPIPLTSVVDALIRAGLLSLKLV